MPDRIVREAIKSSEAFNRLDWPARECFRLLINEADDFGRFDARSSSLRPAMYPLILDRVREADVERWLAACQSAGVIVLYEYESKSYGIVATWKARPRARHSKFPQPPEGVYCWRGVGGISDGTAELTTHVRDDDNAYDCASMRAYARTCKHVRANASSNASSNPKQRARAGEGARGGGRQRRRQQQELDFAKIARESMIPTTPTGGDPP
jgi:hypothetical protein